MRLATADLLLLVGVLCFVFGLGSSILIFGQRTDWRHPLRWARATYTMKRWLTNPFKLAQVALLWQANFQQLALTGPVMSLAGDLDYRPRLYLTLANLIGGCIAFYGLHLRDFELSLWVELGSYIALTGTLGLWVTLVYLTIPLPNTSYGLNLTEGFLIACLIRGALIVVYKAALRCRSVKLQARLSVILGGAA